MAVQEHREMTEIGDVRRSRRGEAPESEARRERVADQVKIPPPLIFLALAAAGVGLHLVFPVSLLPWWILGAAVGVLIIAVGVGLLVASVRTLRDANTDHTGLEPTTALVKHGPFRWSRNPIFLGVLLWLPGLSLALNTIWLRALSLLLFLFFRWVVVVEEQYLERRFVEEYLRYKSSVRRWI